MSYILSSIVDKGRNSLAYLLNKKYKSDYSTSKHIHFLCGFHGLSGGSEAIVAIANQLATTYKVTFSSYPLSRLNVVISQKVRIVNHIPLADLFFIDRSLEEETLQIIRRLDKPIIVSIHGKPNTLHGLGNTAMQVFSYATHAHFVSKAQAKLFENEAKNSFIIPNSSADLSHYLTSDNTRCQRRVGLVGNFKSARKNLKQNIQIGLESKCSKIVVWGDVNKKVDNKKVIYKGYGHNKSEIYSSFDVFLSLSKDENLPLTIIQALNAGIPCVLSKIESHSLFADCEGVILVDLDNDTQIVNAIDDLLNRSPDLHQACYDFWFKNFSDEVVSKRWLEKIALT
jgi:hypothetical protein